MPHYQLELEQKTLGAELNLAGQFDWDPAMSDDDLLTELAGGRWMPGTDDFAAVPGGTVLITPTFGNMLGAIFQKGVGSISRVNLFTHANKDLIGFGGTMSRNSLAPADVMMNTNGTGDNLTAMDPVSMAALNQPGVFFTMPKIPRISVPDIQKRFASDGMIVLYACHSGQIPSFIKSIATFFNTKVIGFSDLIGYYPPSQTTPHKFLRTGMKIGLGFGGTPVSDWRGLISNAKAITMTP